MNEEEVVRLFLRNGFQISKNALPLTLDNTEQILSELQKMKPRPFIISEQHIKNIQKTHKTKNVEVKIIKDYKQEKKPAAIKDYVVHFLSRYEEIKDILSKKMETERLTSINKIATQSMMFSIIGVIKEKNNNNIQIEDTTGEVYVFFEDDLKEKLSEIELDDVIGLSVKKNKDKYYAKTVVFPDVSSNREIGKTENETILAVVSNPTNLGDTTYKNLISTLSSTQNLSTIVFFSDTKSEKLTTDFSGFNSIFPKENPTLFQIDGIKILTLPKKIFETLTFDSKTSEPFTPMLKKRHLYSQFSPETHVGHDDFVLTELPDIIVSNLGVAMNKNYKGTTILSNSDPNKIFLINLKTRQVTEKIL